MFGLFKAKPAPEGPVAFEFAMDFACSAEDLYRTIDFGDPRCWKRDVGSVNPTGPKQYCMVLDMVPDMEFHLEVHDEIPNEAYSYSCVMQPRPGKLLKSTEGYRITPKGESDCEVLLAVAAEFEPGMTEKEWQGEVEMMAIAVNNSLAKLKIHVEQGVESILEIEDVQKVA